MLEPKVPAIGASIGFVLSFLTGLISGASFPIVLLRAFFMAVLFGALVVLVRVLVMKFIPDLLEDVRVDANSDETMGSSVNITIDDTARENTAFDDTGDQGTEGMIPDFLESDASLQDEKPVFVPGMSVKAASAPVSSNLSSNSQPGSLKGSSAGTVTNVQSSDGLDVLPDLQDFVPQKGVDDEEKDESEEVVPVVHTGMNVSGFTASDQKDTSVEAETMAKAIRTILSHDN